MQRKLRGNDRLLAARLRKGYGRCRLPPRLSALRDNRSVDSAAHVEAGAQSQEARLHRRVQMIGDFVRDRLVKCTAVAEGPDVELQRLQLHAALIRHVLQFECREVRLPGARTQTRELRYLHANGVV